MRKLRIGFAIALVTLAFSSAANAMFLPLNNLHREDNPSGKSNIDEATFRRVMERARVFYDPIVRSLGGNLNIEGDWEDSTVNAHANQAGDMWNVKMYGGLARRPEVTPDGFALVVCHELGHHLGGYPTYPDSSWSASVEGESDYYATHACARSLWRHDHKENAYYRTILNPETQFSCNWMWRRQEDQNLCYRIAFASISLSTLLSRLASNPADPSLAARDRNIVRQTYAGHPQAQCRLDTMLSGALCNVPFNIGFIPGRSAEDQRRAEWEAMRFSCRQERGDPRTQPRYGARPQCWFKSHSH